MPDYDPHLTEEDCHLTLAALRFLQASLPQIPDEIRAIATNDGDYPLPNMGELAEHLDILCEFINTELPQRPVETEDHPSL